ncbi:hypothetical protein L209DRAFT_160994 [Thermothelomyces heterothallicus CBS 203.75]
MKPRERERCRRDGSSSHYRQHPTHSLTTPSSLRAHFPSRQPSPPPGASASLSLLGCWCEEAIRSLCAARIPKTKRPKRANKWRRDRGKKENTTKNNRSATRRVEAFSGPRFHGRKGTQKLVPSHRVALSPPHLPPFPAPSGFRRTVLGHLPPARGELRGTEGGIGDTRGVRGQTESGEAARQGHGGLC